MNNFVYFLVSCCGLFIDNARKEQYTLDDLLRSDLRPVCPIKCHRPFIVLEL